MITDILIDFQYIDLCPLQEYPGGEDVESVGRRHWLQLAELLDQAVSGQVEFAKAIPGFRNLSQVSIILQ